MKTAKKCMWDIKTYQSNDTHTQIFDVRNDI